MKVLLDSCVWAGARHALVDAGHDVTTVADEWSADPGDQKILDAAHASGRVLITLDKDFGELAVVKNVEHAGIVRLVAVRARDQGPVSARVLADHEEELALGAIVTVEPDRVRIRSGRPR